MSKRTGIFLKNYIQNYVVIFIETSFNVLKAQISKNLSSLLGYCISQKSRVTTTVGTPFSILACGFTQTAVS